MLPHLHRANVVLRSPRWRWSRPLLARTSSFSSSRDRNEPRLVVGDLEEAPRTARTPELVPRGYLNGIENIPEFVAHIRWLLQKHRLGQDVFLMGFPTSLRRHVVMAAAELFNWEVEYMPITRDTTEADLKQRREIVGDSVRYFDQAPVRAAVQGRVLVLDGIENAERNVLPCLNNLLENREMALDDGSFLSNKLSPQALDAAASAAADTAGAARIVPVHPDFRVIALGLPVPPFPGRTLDPPLRSRFQCRFIDELDSTGLMNMSNVGGYQVPSAKSLIGFYETMQSLRRSAIAENGSMTGLPVLSLDALNYCINFNETFPGFSPLNPLRRCVPATFSLRHLVPRKYEYTLAEAVANVQRSSGGLFTSDPVSGSTYSVASITRESHFSSKGEFQHRKTGTVVKNLSCGERDLQRLEEVKAQLLPMQLGVLEDVMMDHAMGKHICILGPKGSGKTLVARSFCNALGYDMRTFPLYNDLTSRDLLQRRATDSAGNTSWVDSPLTAAAKNGDVCVLDGIERLDAQTLLSLKRLLHDSALDLPDGGLLIGGGNLVDASGIRNLSNQISIIHDGPMARPVQQIHPSFRVIVLGLTPGPKAVTESARQRWVSAAADLGLAHHFLANPSVADMQAVIMQGNENLVKNGAIKISSKQWEEVAALMSEAINKILVLSESNLPELTPSFVHALRIQKVLAASVSTDMAQNRRKLRYILDGEFLVKFLPAPVAARFDTAMQDIGLGRDQLHMAPSIASDLPASSILNDNPLDPYAASSGGIQTENSQRVVFSEHEGKQFVQVGDIKVPQRASSRPEMVPRPLFHENAVQLEVLREMLASYASGVRAMLLIGNQGVGKNKLVDRLLQVLNAEREYVQLHRDSTVQSLTVVPNLIDGKIYYEDSPMVRAANQGTILVMDEVDKAPVEVVSLLKMLVQDGELLLPDGRRLLDPARCASSNVRMDEKTVPIHPDFRLIALANRPGFPFHGNNFFRDCGDAFTTHVVDNLDVASEIELLRAYGPDVPLETLTKLTLSFQDLRLAHASGKLNYPFSAREAVAVVKHLQAFPQDGVAAALEDFLGFEGALPKSRRILADVLNNRGIPVSASLGAGASMLSPHIELASPYVVPRAQSSGVITAGKWENATSDSFLTSEIRGMRFAPWKVVRTATSSYSMKSGRLELFSEKVGTIQLEGAGANSSGGGEILSTTVDSAGTVHVLADQPLTLHSFYDAPDAVSVGGEMEKRYVQRTLLSENATWKLGRTNAFVVPFTARPDESPASGAGGVLVVVPELSLGIRIGGGLQSDATAASLPLQPVDTSGLMGKLFKSGNSRTSSNKPTPYKLRCARISYDQRDLCALWYQDAEELFVIDSDATSATAVKFSGHNISSMRYCGRASDDRSNDWLVNYTTEGNTASGACILRIPDDGAPPSMSNLTGGIAHSALQSRQVVLGSSSGSDTGVTSWSWESDAAAVVQKWNEAKSSVSYEMWKRADIKAGALPQVIDVRDSFVSKDIAYSAIISTDDSRSEFQTSLEVLETTPALARNIVLQPPVSSLASSHSPSNNGRHRRPSHSEDVSIRGIIEIPSTVRGLKAPQSAATLSSESGYLGVVYSNGVIDIYDADHARLERDLNAFKSMFPSRSAADSWTIKRINGPASRGEDQEGKPRTGLNEPKHGKEDPNNEVHVGGNTWAGGTGGSDTAGLGGRGGPYRLDSGHTVHQVSDEAKAAVSAEAKKKAAEIAKTALEKRLKDISLGKDEYDIYNRFKGRVEAQVDQLRSIIAEFSKRSKERVWLRNQSNGELDDTRIVDGLAGERLVFRRRGTPHGAAAIETSSNANSPETIQKRIEIVMDVSGSMYRFNGQDRRLERMLETAMMVMEAMPRFQSDSPSAHEVAAAGNADDDGTHADSGDDTILRYAMSGHSGDSSCIPFVRYGRPPRNEKDVFAALQAMIAHSQYCSSGDHTLEAIDEAVSRVMDSATDDTGADCQRVVIVVSDANFRRYGISPDEINRAMTRNPKVKVHLILIATLGDEARSVAAALPEGCCHVCDGSGADGDTDIVSALRTILVGAGGLFDTAAL